jgi:hypothetical protein
MRNDELGMISKEMVVAYSRYYPGICLEVLKKTKKSLGQDSRCPDRHSNPAPPEYKPRAFRSNIMLPFSG